MKNKDQYAAVTIGTSLGGLAALTQIIPTLPENFLPTIIVQHIQERSENLLVPYLDRLSAMHVKEASPDEAIQKGCVYIAPPGYHLLIDYNHTFALSVDERVNYSRPSIDVLFESAGMVYQSQLIAVILTGANSDGTQGLRVVKKYGGLVVAEDPETAEAATMPRSAIDAGLVDFVLPLADIADFLQKKTIVL